MTQVGAIRPAMDGLGMSVLSTRAGRLALQGADGEDGPGERGSSRALMACLDAACAILDRLRGRERSHDTPHIGPMPTSRKAAASDQTQPI
jgi:hypothetical protein